MSETARRLGHVGTLAALPLLVLLPRGVFLLLMGAAAALVLLAGPAILAPRARPGEGGRRFAFAVASFPIALLVLLLLFPDRPEAAAAAWALLAAGDGMAGLAGRRLGGPRLPWNRAKSVAGAAAFLAAGYPAALGAVRLIGGPGAVSDLGGILAAAALVAAFVESVPSRLGDNLPVALAAGLLVGLHGADGALPEAAGRMPGAIAGVGAVAAAGLAAGAIDRRGAVAGFLLGAVVWAGAGPGAFALVALFVVLGSAVSRLRTGRGVRRGARHALANLAVPAYLALLGALGAGAAATAALAAAVAAALADTVSGEIGMLSSAPPRLIWGGRTVEPGTDGGVTLLGTAAGAAGAALVALLAPLLGVTAWGAAAVVGVAGFSGTLADSLLGATAERAGLVGNEEVNFLAAAFAATVAGLWVGLAGA